MRDRYHLYFAVRAKIEAKFLPSCFNGDLRPCRNAVAQRIREVKRIRSQMRRDKADTLFIDKELSMLRFGAWVLDKSIKDVANGNKPWLNGGSVFV